MVNIRRIWRSQSAGFPCEFKNVWQSISEQTSSSSSCSFLFAVVIPVKHASRKITDTRGKLRRRNFLPCHGISSPIVRLQFLSVPRFDTYPVHCIHHARPICNLHSNVSHRHFGLPSNVLFLFSTSVAIFSRVVEFRPRWRRQQRLFQTVTIASLKTWIMSASNKRFLMVPVIPRDFTVITEPNYALHSREDTM